MTLDEPYNPTYVHWFGEPWPRRDHRATVCEDDRYEIPTPIGHVCVNCDEEIIEGDRGVRYSGSAYFSHAECNLRAVTGNLIHILGQCRHRGDCNARSELSYREEARQVWEHYELGPPGSIHADT